MPRPGPFEFQKFLSKHNEGDVVTEDDILRAVPSWKKSSLDTYRKKHKLDRYISYVGDKKYRVMRDGHLVTEADINAALTQVTPRELSLAHGDLLEGDSGKYILLRSIGRGAVGAVWCAQRQGSETRVAIKVCDPRSDLLVPSVLPNVRDRFRRESRLGPQMRHDALIAYLDVGDHLKAPFLVMELADESLRDYLERVAKLSVAEVAVVGRCVVAGLRHLHRNNCVHRDVKPPNILRTERGWVLGDLGIVQWGQLNRDFTGAGTITKATVQLGSWNYMPTEQLQDAHKVTPSTDIYALGVTLIEALTGAVPIAQMVAAGRVPPPSNEKLLNDLIARMTAYEAKDRPSLDDVDDVLSIICKRHSAEAGVAITAT